MKLRSELKTKSAAESSRLAWATHQVPNQPGLHRKRKKNLDTDTALIIKGWQDAIVAWELRASGGCREDRCSMTDKSFSKQNKYIRHQLGQGTLVIYEH